MSVNLWAALSLVIKATSDDPAGHLPNCGYTDEAQACGCSAWGERVHDALKQIVATAESEALREARDALYRGEGPDLFADSDIIYGEWLGNRADRIGGAA